MNHDELDILLKEVSGRELAAAPKTYNEEQSRYGTCPPIWRYGQAAAKNTWSPDERQHVRGCPYCQKSIAMQWSLSCPNAETLKLPGFHEAAYIHTASCSRCRKELREVADAPVDVRGLIPGANFAGPMGAEYPPDAMPIRVPLFRSGDRESKADVDIALLPPLSNEEGEFEEIGNRIYLSRFGSLMATLMILEVAFPEGLDTLRVEARTATDDHIQPVNKARLTRGGQPVVFEFELAKPREQALEMRFVLLEEE